MQPQEIAALAAAVIAHELGHLMAMLQLGMRFDGLTLAATGPVLRCSGALTCFQEIAASLSGPLFGAGFWLLLRRQWLLAAEMSAVLTAVNLLPILPLDGGRALRALLSGSTHGAKAMLWVRRSLLFLLFACGAWCAAAGWGPALLLFSAWLLIAPDLPSALAKQRRLM